jgi:hypothetical protein
MKIQIILLKPGFGKKNQTKIGSNNFYMFTHKNEK